MEPNPEEIVPPHETLVRTAHSNHFQNEKTGTFKPGFLIPRINERPSFHRAELTNIGRIKESAKKLSEKIPYKGIGFVKHAGIMPEAFAVIAPVKGNDAHAELEMNLNWEVGGLLDEQSLNKVRIVVMKFSYSRDPNPTSPNWDEEHRHLLPAVLQ